jgi:hypothetical protein
MLTSRFAKVLEKAFNSDFREGLTKNYEINDTTPDTFRIFVQWLYTQKMPNLHEECRTDIEVDGRVVKDHGKCTMVTSSLLGLWILAATLIIPRL